MQLCITDVLRRTAMSPTPIWDEMVKTFGNPTPKPKRKTKAQRKQAQKTPTK